MYKHLGIFIIFIAVSFGGFSLWQYFSDASETIVSERPSFQADLTRTLDLQAGVGVPTFTRADAANYSATVTDFEGLIKPVKSGEARFEGARRVENLLTFSEDFSNAVWTCPGNNAAVVSNSVMAPDGSMAGDTINFTTTYNNGRCRSITTNASGVYRASVWLKADSLGTIGFSAYNNETGSAVLSVTTSWQRFTVLFNASDPGGIFLRRQNGTQLATVYAWGAQLEDVTGQANQNPSEYVSTNVLTAAPYHGANVDGVKYFTTQNGNTVASNVVTEATGTAIPDATLHGYVAEGARTNLALQSEAFYATSWTKAGVSTGNATTTSPAGTNTGNLLTEDSNPTTQHRLSQTVTTFVSGTSYTISAYVKRGSGTRNVQLGLTGAISFARVYFDLTNGTVGSQTNGTGTIASVGNGWYRITATGTSDLTGGTGYIFLANTNGTTVNSETYSGDGTSGIYWWGAQLEAGSFASSYIPTTTASVFRNGDILTYPTDGNVNNSTGTAFAAISSYQTTADQRSIIDAYDGVSIGIPLFITQTTSLLGLFDGSSGIRTGGAISNPITTPVKIASKWGGSASSFFKDGAQSGTSQGFNGDMDMTAPMAIGVRSNSILPLYGTIRNVKIWKKALTDTQLTNLTSTVSAVAQSAVKKTTVNASQNLKLTDGLVGLWSFNGTDISGTTAYDRSGQNNNGTITGATKTIGKVGQALSFDGTDDYVDTGSTFSSLTSALSLSLWVRPGASQVQYADIIGNHAGGGFTGIVIERDATIADQYAFFYGVGAAYAQTNNFTLTTDTWHHVAVVKDASGATVFVDGVSVASVSDASSVSPSSFTLKIGNSISGIRYWNGKIDEVRIYNRALSAAEIKLLYNLGR